MAAYEQLYWTPRYIGLRSIPRKLWQVGDELICVPKEAVNESASLYTRDLRHGELVGTLHRNEEILNHFFDLTFSIAPDQVISELFLQPFGFSDAGPFETVGREIRQRYGWGESENVTQQDGFFVSADSAIGVEIKLDSKSWSGQTAKYAALLTWEEMFVGPKRQLGLLYIVPEGSVEDHWSGCGLAGPLIDRTFLDTDWDRKLPSRVAALLRDHPDEVASVLDRMHVTVITWTAFRRQLFAIQERLNTTHPGDQTLYRLLQGFLAQLERHQGTGIPA